MLNQDYKFSLQIDESELEGEGETEGGEVKTSLDPLAAEEDVEEKPAEAEEGA